MAQRSVGLRDFPTIFFLKPKPTLTALLGIMFSYPWNDPLRLYWFFFVCMGGFFCFVLFGVFFVVVVVVFFGGVVVVVFCCLFFLPFHTHSVHSRAMFRVKQFGSCKDLCLPSCYPASRRKLSTLFFSGWWDHRMVLFPSYAFLHTVHTYTSFVHLSVPQGNRSVSRNRISRAQGDAQVSGPRSEGTCPFLLYHFQMCLERLLHGIFLFPFAPNRIKHDKLQRV